MTTNFIQLSAIGSYGGESIINLFDYSYGSAGDAFAHAADVEDLFTAWQSAMQALYLAAFDTPYVLASLLGKGFNTDGTAGLFTPPTRAVNAAGTTAQTTVGANVGLIFKKAVAAVNTVSHGGTPPKRGYFFISPIASNMIDESSVFTPTGTVATAYTALLAALKNNVVGALHTYVPAVLSHTGSAHELVTDVTAYSLITAVTREAKTKSRNSRQNGR